MFPNFRLDTQVTQGNPSAASRVTDADFCVVSDRVLFVSKENCRVRAAALVVEDGRIAEILEAETARKGQTRERLEQSGVEMIDVGDAPLVPGFVNGHTHLAMAPLRGITDRQKRAGNVIRDVFFRMESHLTADDVLSFTRMGAYESLLCGVTEVWDHYYFGGAVARGLLEVGIGGVVAPTLQNLSGPGCNQFRDQWDATLELHNHSGFQARGIRAALGPHATDTVSEDLLKEIGEQARESGLPIHLHAAQTFDEVIAAREETGRSLAQRLLEAFSDTPQVLVAHGLFLSAEECARFVGQDWTLAFCPYSQLQFGFLGPLRSWLEKGGTWALGTDCVASNDALDVQRELPLVAGLGALSTSFSEPRQRVLAGQREARRELEEHRKAQVARSPADASELLVGAFGCNLPGAPQAPLSVGTPANFLVMDSHHPSLFPDNDVARALAYGSTQGAIRWLCVRGRAWGRKDGLAGELLNSPHYRHARYEASRRYAELLERARMPLAPYPA